ncbi:MAG TPA: penicillin-binding protein activator LpoB [Pontiellaceae bacterium]|nr:penicillin-binding protein activator LpoB [Pontiellaceae bacterium]HPR82610.1 penicillin-binding protein activator LpoB [Pontiellaceae bacterium]
MKKLVFPVCLLCCVAVLCGCQTRVHEVPLDRAAATTKLEPQDIRRTVEKMVESLLVAPGVKEFVSNRRPVLDVEPMQNRTTQHVDMVSLTESVRMQLLRSGMFRFVDRSSTGTAAIDVARIHQENQLGLVDSTKAVKAGQQTALDMYLTGTLSEIKNVTGRTTDQYYKFSMILKDLKTGEIVWADEQEIRKESTRPAVRW